MSLKKIIRKRLLSLFKFGTLKVIYPITYKFYARKIVDDKKVIFIQKTHDTINNSFQVMYDKVKEQNKYKVKIHFIKAVGGSKFAFMHRCLELIKDLATAKYVFTDEAIDVYGGLPIRKETIGTNLWHGCGAFKKFGFSTADKIFGGNMKTQQRYPMYKNITNVTVSSPEVSWAYEEAMGISKESNIVKATGVSRTDVFYDIEYKNKAFEKLYSLFPEAKGKKIILYAPTFRGRVAKAQMPDVFDFKEFAEKLSDEYVVVANYHPLVKQPPEVPEDCLTFARDLTGQIGINELIVISDICISDYSSLVFEYSLMEKPMIFYAFDLDEYLDWRGFYYPYDEMTPGPICKTNYEMIYYIQNIDELFDKQKVVDFKHKFMRSCDGHSTDRIFELVFHKETEDMLRKTN